MDPVIAYLGLGSNLGDRQNNLNRAADILSRNPGLRLKRSSSVYETAPWGYPEQPNFLNCVLEVSTSLSPPDLLHQAQEVECTLGRTPTVRYGPRLIDVDILLYGDRIIDLEIPDLHVPHLMMAERAFVLVPLAELAPNLVHPKLGLDIGELASRMADGGEVAVWGPPLRFEPTPNVEDG